MAVNNAGLIQNSLKAAQQRFKDVREKKAQAQGNSANSGLMSNNQSSINNSLPNQSSQPVPTVPTVNERWQSKQTVPDYLGMTPDMIQKALAGATSGSQYYDPDQDPVYKSMLELSQKQADSAGLQAMELLNERGILNSAVTTDRLGQIKQGASDAVLASIPGLAANFNNKQSQNAASLQSLLNSVINAGQFQQTFAEDNLRYDKGFDEDKRRYDKQFSLDEAAVTGKYLTQGTQDAVQAILNAKQLAEDPSTPLEQRKKANADANAARQLLVSQGVDVSMLGADSSYRQAMNALNSLGGAGISTMDNQKMQFNNALAVGDMTGSYTPTGAQSLVNELLRLKQESEKGGITKSEKQGNSNRAQQLRAQLSSMGINADALFGANVTAQQAAANANRMGTQTEAARQFNSELGMKKDQLAFERQSFDRKMNFEESSFDRKMNFEEQQAMIEADLKSRGLDLDAARIEIDRFATQSEVQYKQQLADLEINAKTAEQNTNAAIGEALKAKNISEAIAFIAESASAWSQNGVNVKSVLDSLEYKFPGIKDAATTSGSSNSVYSTP